MTEDVVIDPIGKVDRVLEEMRQEIAEEITSKGYYGFENGKWILIVHSIQRHKGNLELREVKGASAPLNLLRGGIYNGKKDRVA